MRKVFHDNWSFIFVGGFILLSMVYVFLYGDNIIIPVHDNLDSNVAWAKMISDNNLWWKIGGEVPFLGGIDRIYFPSFFKIYTFVYAFFSTFTAFVLCWFLKIIISVFGFVYLGKTIFNNYENNKHVIVLSGFLYGLTPTFPSCSFAFASLPIILALFVKYYRENNNKYLLYFLLFPILSDFSMFGIFILFYATIYTLFQWIKARKIKFSMLSPIMALILGYIIAEYNIFYLMLFSNEPTIRSSFIFEYLNGFQVLKTIIDGFVYGHYHSGSLHTFVVFPTCLVYLFFIIIKNYREKTLKNILKNPFIWLIILLLFNSLIYGLDNYYPFKSIMEKILPPLKGFGFARTLWFNPFLWYLAFAVALCNIFKKFKIRYVLILLAFIVFIVSSSEYNFLRDNQRFISYNIRQKQFAKMTYSEFYSEKLFSKIKKDINYNGEWAIAFGMHPAILEYNGISTLDGYLSFYSLEYKNKFADLIKPEFESNISAKKYFNDWGGRAYIFSDKVSFHPQRDISVDNAILKINSEVFAEMNGEYVFSLVEISNAKDLHLKYLNKYEDNNSPYLIFVYKFNKN